MTFLKRLFFILITLWGTNQTTWAAQDPMQDPQDHSKIKSATQLIKGVEVDSRDFFHLSFTPIFDFFTIDEKSQRFLDKINPLRVKQELDRLSQLTQSLCAQVPINMVSMLQDTLTKNQLSAIESVYQGCPTELTSGSFLLTPLSEDHLRNFRNATYKDFLGHSQFDENIHTALKKVISFGFFPFEREIIILGEEFLFLHVLGLDQFLDIEDHIKDIRYYTGGDESKHVDTYRCCKPYGWDRKFLQHRSASDGSCWCLTIDRHRCYPRVINKINQLLYGNLECKKLTDWDDSFKKNLCRYREAYQEAKKILQETKQNITIDFIDQEISLIRERHAARFHFPGETRKKYTWDIKLYPAYEKLSQFRYRIDNVLDALKIMSSAQEDFNQEGPKLRCGVVHYDVLSESHIFRAKPKNATLPNLLKELGYLIRIPYKYDERISKFLKKFYLTYNDAPEDIFYWSGYLAQ